MYPMHYYSKKQLNTPLQTKHLQIEISLLGLCLRIGKVSILNIPTHYKEDDVDGKVQDLL